ncbi:MAG: N-6 DNA methylase, partial [Actinobacteria bacterium]|nr:N-6 DNA methylase [Actinomycetota bacterium]
MRAPQTSAAPSQRKRLGAWYTPVALVDHVVSRTVREGVTTVLDPACGEGAFLAGVRRAFGPSVHLVGVDVDAGAVAAARAALPDAEIIHADALSFDWGDRTFDAVVGNPPFLNQMATATTRGGRSRFGGGPYADTAAEFLALSVSLARPDGGRVGLVLPQSLLSARDAGPI